MLKKTYFPIVCAVLLAGASIAYGAAPEKNGVSRRDNSDIVNRNFSIFSNVVNTVERNYVDTLPLQQMFDKAIYGFLSVLDPYTSYFDEKEAEAFEKSTQGEYGGIGSYLMLRGEYMYINKPQEGSPANMAGLRSGDKILRIDSVDVKGLGYEKTREMLLGMPGTPISLQVSRPYVGADSIIDVTFSRALLDLPTVNYFGVDDSGIGYIEISSFGTRTAEEVRTALSSIIADKKLKGIVLDLSGNGGGLLESAVEILEMFVPKGTEVLSTKGTRGNKTYVTEKKPIVPADMPLAVIIDGGSASAAEVVAGVLQDLDRAVIAGSKSYGKGLVQTTFPGPYGTLVKVTTAKYYIPSGRLIQAYDYSHRGEDGSVRNLPDSLARPFLTKGGRTVYDGGGLRPDMIAEFPDALPIVLALAENYCFFDYANKYFAIHDTITSPVDFRITDDIFADFKKSVLETKIDYNTDTGEALKQLRTVAKQEGFLGDEAEKRLSDLEKELAPNIERDIDAARQQIEILLTPEIIERYYHARGQQISNLNFDVAYKVAHDILLSPEKYKSILSPKKK